MNSELYSQVLGKDWLALAEIIRCAHSVGREITGLFRITHGAGLAARLLARWSDLPQATDTAETRLTVISEGAWERWERRFDGKMFATRQWKDNDGNLVERYREWELFFKLRAEQGCLFYDQIAARLCVGTLRIPMP